MRSHDVDQATDRGICGKIFSQRLSHHDPMPLQAEDVMAFGVRWSNNTNAVDIGLGAPAFDVDAFVLELASTLSAPILDSHGSPDERLTQVADTMVSCSRTLLPDAT